MNWKVECGMSQVESEKTKGERGKQKVEYKKWRVESGE
jgi:hypothetical protein